MLSGASITGRLFSAIEQVTLIADTVTKSTQNSVITALTAEITAAQGVAPPRPQSEPLSAITLQPLPRSTRPLLPLRP